MGAPKEIYLFQSKNDGSVGVAHHKHPVETEKTTSIKYIRADIAELTWEDIAKIDAIIVDVNNEFAVDYSKEISRQKFYEEVLNRFNKQRKK